MQKGVENSGILFSPTLHTITAGLVAGSAQALVFSPYDRGLFLCHLHHRSFLDRRNFKRPYEGFHQAILLRIITGGLYFPIESAIGEYIPDSLGVISKNLVSGAITGTIMAIVTNPLSFIKYQSWDSHHRGRLIATTMHIWSNGGFHPFTRGISATIVRDIIWGSTYSSVRHSLPQLFDIEESQVRLENFLINVFAGGVATLFSAPINFIRNIQYGHTTQGIHPSASTVMRGAWNDSKHFRFPVYYFLIKRLAIGWGTLRVALGIAFSSQVYSFLMNSAND